MGKGISSVFVVNKIDLQQIMYLVIKDMQIQTEYLCLEKGILVSTKHTD